MDNTTRCHVVILASPGIGHLIPILHLSKWLVTLHSVEVTVFIIPTHSSTAQSPLLHSSQLPHGLYIVNLPPVDISTFVTNDTLVFPRISLIVRESLTSFRSEIASMSFPPTALIVDLFGTPAFNIADQMKIPNKYVFFTTTAWVLSLTMYVRTLDHEVEGEYVDLKEPIRIPGCKPIRPDDVIDPMLDRKNESYTWYLRMAQGFRLANGFIMNTWEDLEPLSLRALRENPILRQIGVPPVYPIGPLVTTVGQENETRAKECLDWLHVQPKGLVLYVSFGSGGTLSQEQMSELAWGLELSQQRFIWAIRPPSAENVSDGTYFSTGSEHDDPRNYLPEGFLKRIEGVGMVVPKWAPQVEILSHPSTGGFLSHSGWNSTLESIINGVPMIAWPLYAEQKMNASLLADDLGVAIRPEVLQTKGGVIRREEIEIMVRLVMEGKEGEAMRSRMKELGHGGLKAIDLDGSSYNSLCGLVKEWEINPQCKQ